MSKLFTKNRLQRDAYTYAFTVPNYGYMGAPLLGAVFGTILYFLGASKELMLISIGTLAMPMGLNNVVFPEAFGGDSETGAQTCFVSGVLALITIPIVFGIISIL